MSLVIKSPCKVNLLLNVLCRREDGFHEIESIMQPVPIHDELHIERAGSEVELTCSNPRLSVGVDNLVHRAATEFLKLTKFGGVRIHLVKNRLSLPGAFWNWQPNLVPMSHSFCRTIPRWSRGAANLFGRSSRLVR